MTVVVPLGVGVVAFVAFLIFCVVMAIADKVSGNARRRKETRVQRRRERVETRLNRKREREEAVVQRKRLRKEARAYRVAKVQGALINLRRRVPALTFKRPPVSPWVPLRGSQALVVPSGVTASAKDTLPLKAIKALAYRAKSTRVVGALLRRKAAAYRSIENFAAAAEIDKGIAVTVRSEFPNEVPRKLRQLARPIRESAVFWSDWCVRTPPLTRRTGLPSAFHRLTTGTLQRA